MSYSLDFTKNVLKGVEAPKKTGDKKLLIKLAAPYLELKEYHCTMYVRAKRSLGQYFL